LYSISIYIVHKLIDIFIDIIKAMLARTANRELLYNRILSSFKLESTDQIIEAVRNQFWRDVKPIIGYPSLLYQLY